MQIATPEHRPALARAAERLLTEIDAARPPSVVADVDWSRMGGVYWAEVAGELLRPARDQDEARHDRAISRDVDRLYDALPADLHDAFFRVRTDAEDHVWNLHRETLRTIGHMLVNHGQPALWRLVYLQAESMEEYALGDELRFLYHVPMTGQPGFNLDDGYTPDHPKRP